MLGGPFKTRADGTRAHPADRPSCGMRHTRCLVLASALFVGMHASAVAQSPAAGSAPSRIAHLDRCVLEHGGVIEDCDLAYRTFGAMAPARDNVIVFTTWFLGRTADLLSFYIGGPERLVDTTQYYVVAIDALGNGQSASPSTSRSQPGARFPRFTMRDLVDTQHRLLHDVLALDHVYAVMGASMGGMQIVQWTVQFPGYMDKAVAIVPTPRTATYDRILWNTELRAIEHAAPEMPRDSLLALLEGIHALALQTPAYVNRIPPDSADGVVLRGMVAMRPHFDPWDWASQLRAMLSHDVGASFGGSLQRAAHAVHARTLLVVAAQDHMVTPASIYDWARWTRAALLELRGNCGHLAAGCEQDRVKPAVRAFLTR